MSESLSAIPPILTDKHHASASIFTPEGLLREARRQKALPATTVPSVCVLDPDGDLVRRLIAEGSGRRDPTWACYHTELYRADCVGIELGLVGSAVGAPFAVLVAEQLFASGCRFLISMTSAGQLKVVRQPPYFVLIEEALRDEGTSYHYLAPAAFSDAPQGVTSLMDGAFDGLGISVECGATWTTDAPFRETSDAVKAMRSRGLFAVEMEAAALYAFATARQKPVLCFAHVTNQMAQVHGDFEKGEADGTVQALAVILAAARRFLQSVATGRDGTSGG
jgi:uridine phosphorylase